MKTQNKPHYLIMAIIAVAVAAGTWSCNKDDDPSLADLREDKLQYLEDSLRISDSLKRINSAGVVNYTITVVSGSTSSLFKNGDFDGGRQNKTKSAVSGAIVTISQFGKTQSDTTDESGMVVFNGYFRTAVNVTIRKEGFTSVSYISVVNTVDSTVNNGIYFVGNLIPIFELTGNNTATITGRATIETNLTNRTRELVPDGTKFTASIDASSEYFAEKFLTSGIEYYGYGSSDTELIYVGNLLDVAYSTNIIGTVTGGNYSLTVPAAVNGLPIELNYSDIAANQTLYEFTPSAAANRVVTVRTIYSPNFSPSFYETGTPVSVIFSGPGSGASAYPVIENGVITSIVLLSGGSGYTTAPSVTISGGAAGSGATATATVAGGVVTGVTVTAGGAGYVSNNTPAEPISFFDTYNWSLDTKPGLTYINDVYYGTGLRQPN